MFYSGEGEDKIYRYMYESKLFQIFLNKGLIFL